LETDMNNDKAVIDKIAAELIAVEKQVYTQIMSDLSKDNPRPDAAACDKIFGIYTHAYLLPCVSQGFAFRAAVFSRKRLIPAVLGLERKLSVEFHKGALFYDTGLAHLVAGNENGYEYFLAMTDEEEFRKTGGGHPRGTVNLRSDGLAAQTVRKRMQFACDLLNGKVAAHTLDLAFATGIAPLDSAQFDGWRQKLNSLHQFELLRIIHDVEVFVGADYPNYSRVADNPFVMLRLAKALSHFAQWVESCLSHWQGGIVGTLSNKLQNDLDFGNRLSTCAGGGANFAGNNPPIAALDDQLRQLLADAAAAPAGDQRHWRLLRILYIVRNSTAHTIEPNLAIYQDRALLLSLLQVVFVSALVICQLKGRSLP
jgi:hypothetical protein